MKKTLTVTVSSVLAFLAFNNAAHAQQQGTVVKSPIKHNYVSNVQSQTQSQTTYTVVPGDSLYKIALEHHLTLNQLYSYNPGVTPLIFPGDVLSLVPQNKAQQVKIVKTPVSKPNQIAKSTQQPAKQISKNVATKQTVAKTVNVAYKPVKAQTVASTKPVAHYYNKSVANRGNLYAYENCTYYAFDRRAELGRSIGSLWGNANNWNYAAKSAGFKVDKTPEVGAIFQTAAGPYGHVGVVESVNPNGTITVSEMNYAGFNVKSTRTILNPGKYNYIH
ncbi:COG3942 and LysM peptidoglycan-binding domain-containing protein [Staphylococcus argenteus]|uniref:COG3942 and LysM peptidoglycan-binding domain-containing protein n=1 Tax=Staphylococcus argenteus TaxID=985002 RepID=UPI0009244961|nr:CHAP domain-containing protein [Staphylococcus argenteus]SHD23603.1 LysM domain protein [Staphylococcus argenteus]